jgi:hypothetical protein
VKIRLDNVTYRFTRIKDPSEGEEEQAVRAVLEDDEYDDI